MDALIPNSARPPTAEPCLKRTTLATCELVAQTCGGKVFCVYHGIVGVPRCNRCPLSAEEKQSIRGLFRSVQSVLYFFLN
jgi:hypothetical protein